MFGQSLSVIFNFGPASGPLLCLGSNLLFYAARENIYAYEVICCVTLRIEVFIYA